MANVLAKNPDGNGVYAYLESVHSPDYPTANWIINPNIAGVAGVPRLYWKPFNGDSAVEMSQAEKDAVDAALVDPFDPINQVDYTLDNASTRSASWKTVSRVVFRGSDVSGAPKTIKAVAWAESTGYIRVVNAANGIVLCTSNGFTNDEPSVINLGAISNVPAAESVLEVQIKKSGSGRVYANALHLVF